MSIRKVEIERFSMTSSKPLESVVAALKAGVGRLDMVEFTKASSKPRPSLSWNTSFAGT